MPTHNPDCVAYIRDIPSWQGWLNGPPIVVPTLAVAWNAEDGTTADGRFHAKRGEMQGQGVPKAQDTTLVSGRNTGTTFTVVSGTWNDDYVDPQYDVYGILQPDSTADVTWEVVSSAAFNFVPCEFVLRRGMPPAASSSAHSKAGNYAYLHFAYQSTNGIDYRVAFEYGQPFALDVSYDAGATWKRVHQTREAGLLERYLAAHNDLVRLSVHPDPSVGTVEWEIGEGHWFRHTPDVKLTPEQTVADRLPQGGKLRLIGKNGWVSLLVLPLRHQGLNVVQAPLRLDEAKPLPNAGKAFLVGNALTTPDASQATQTSVTTDGQQFTASLTASLPDAGDGLGSELPPRLSDMALVMPADWQFSVPGAYGPDTGVLPVRGMFAEIVSELNDAARTLTSSAVLIANNFDGLYAGAYSHRMLDIWATNGWDYDPTAWPDVDPTAFGWFPMFAGIAGASDQGINLFTVGQRNRMGLPCLDDHFKMLVPIGYEVIYDGWCLFSAVRHVAEACNIHPMFLSTIPLYIPPGATEDAPYGPAGEDCPYPILEKGTGNNPKHRYLPHSLGWHILLALVREQGQPVTVYNPTDPNRPFEFSLPYYVGFDVTRQLRCEPFDPAGLPVNALFSDSDPSGPLEEVRVFNSVAQMRSELNFQGINPLTMELMHYHRTLDPSVLAAIGFRSGHLERDPRFATPEGIIGLAETEAALASLPQQTAALKTTLRPWFSAGQLALVSERYNIGRAGIYVATQVRHRLGIPDLSGMSGFQESSTFVTLRPIENFPNTG